MILYIVRLLTGVVSMEMVKVASRTRYVPKTSQTPIGQAKYEREFYASWIAGADTNIDTQAQVTLGCVQ